MSEMALTDLRELCGSLVTLRLQGNGQQWRWADEGNKQASPIFSSEAAALKWAEDWCGMVEKLSVGPASQIEWQQKDPKRLQKTYGKQPAQIRGYFVSHWVYQPTFLTPEEPRSVEEILARMDKRSLPELEEQLNSAFQQLLARAFIVERVHHPVDAPIPDEEKPLWRLIQIVRAMVDSLSRLVEHRPGLVNPIAEQQATWPVSLSLNPLQIKLAMDMLSELGVGRKAATPTGPGQRVDPNNYFTQLANRAYQACRFNAYLTRELVLHGENAVAISGQLKFWSTRCASKTYVLPDKSWIVVPEPDKIAALSEPVTQENFRQWREAVKLHVLAYWSSFPEKYAEALRQIGKENKEKEYTRRKDALNAVKQAFRSLVRPSVH